MQRAFGLTVLALLLATSVHAESVPLTIGGDTVTVVKKLPFTVTVPAQKNALYFWTHPSTVKSEENRNVLTITSAPLGEISVKVKVITYDKATDDFVETTGQITFVVGAVPPGQDPPDPPTPPTPVSPLVKALRDGLIRDPNDAADASRLPSLTETTEALTARGIDGDSLVRFGMARNR